MIVVPFRGIQLRLMSRNEFAKFLGISSQAYWLWLSKGVFLPPAFKDENNLSYNFGKEKAPRRFYAFQEAVAVRAIMADYVFKTGKTKSPEFVERVHAALRDIREKINNADPSLMDYPLILEFENIAELTQHLSEASKAGKDDSIPELARSLYTKGNKIIKGGGYAKQDRCKTGKRKEGTIKERQARSEGQESSGEKGGEAEN